MASSKQGTVLVTGGTGKVGSCVARLLTSAAQAHLVASRSSSSSTPARPHSVTFDWLDRATWDQPFNITTTTTTTTATGSGTITAGDGNGDHHHLPQAVTAVFLLAPQVFESSPILNDFVDHARGKYGVKRFVLLGATVVEPGGPAMGGTAKYLAELGGKGEIEWCILRPSWFQENWSEQDNLRKDIKSEGRCYSASGDGKIPWVSKFDIAACAVHALTAEQPVNGDLFILGPELLSYADCANILTEVTGKRVVHVNLSSEELAVKLSQDLGLPEDYAKGLAMMDIGINHGGEEKANDVVLSVTGKKPRTFREFAEENKAVWV